MAIDADHVIFGHTHRAGPFAQDDSLEWTFAGGGRLINSGCWVYEPAFLSRGRSSPFWPGAAVELDDAGAPPHVVRLLGDVDPDALRAPDQHHPRREDRRVARSRRRRPQRKLAARMPVVGDQLVRAVVGDHVRRAVDVQRPAPRRDDPHPAGVVGPAVRALLLGGRARRPAPPGRPRGAAARRTASPVDAQQLLDRRARCPRRRPRRSAGRPASRAHPTDSAPASRGCRSSATSRRRGRAAPRARSPAAPPTPRPAPREAESS